MNGELRPRLPLAGRDCLARSLPTVAGTPAPSWLSCSHPPTPGASEADSFSPGCSLLSPLQPAGASLPAGERKGRPGPTASSPTAALARLESVCFAALVQLTNFPATWDPWPSGSCSHFLLDLCELIPPSSSPPSRAFPLFHRPDYLPLPLWDPFPRAPLPGLSELCRC